MLNLLQSSHMTHIHELLHLVRRTRKKTWFLNIFLNEVHSSILTTLTITCMASLTTVHCQVLPFTWKHSGKLVMMVNLQLMRTKKETEKHRVHLCSCSIHHQPSSPPFFSQEKKITLFLMRHVHLKEFSI